MAKESIYGEVTNILHGLEVIWEVINCVIGYDITVVHFIFSHYFLEIFSSCLSFMHGTMMGNIESMRLDKCNAFMVVGKSKLDMLHSYSSHFSKSPTIIIDDLLMLLHNATMRDGESLSLPTLWEYKHHVFTVVIRKSDLFSILVSSLGSQVA